jgi:hypothetical protein
MRKYSRAGVLLAAGMMIAATGSMQARAATVLSGGRTIEVAQTLADPNDLWVSPEDLTKTSGFVVKPEGACLDDICIPIPRGDSALSVAREGKQWINATELARKLGQAYAVDAETGTWSFGEVPTVRSVQLRSAIAPDFELKDRTGKLVHLSDFRGKKVLLKTWASW